MPALPLPLLPSLLLAMKSNRKYANTKNATKNKNANILNLFASATGSRLSSYRACSRSFSISSSISFSSNASIYAFSYWINFFLSLFSVICFYFSTCSLNYSSLMLFSMSLAVLPSLFLTDSSTKPKRRSLADRVYLSFKAHSCNTVLPMLF